MKVSKAVSSAAPEHHRRQEYDQDSCIRLQRDKRLRAFGFDPQRAAWKLEEWHVMFCERIGFKIRSLHVRTANLRTVRCRNQPIITRSISAAACSLPLCRSSFLLVADSGTTYAGGHGRMAKAS